MGMGKIAQGHGNALPHPKMNTERPVTLREQGGASVLTGNNIKSIRKAYGETLRLKRKPQRPEKWDGKTGGRCLQAILEV